MILWRASLAILVGVSATACSSAPGACPTATSLAESELANVVDSGLSTALVSEVAVRQGVPAPRALNAVVADALLAQAAHDKRLDRDPGTKWAYLVASARSLARRLFDDARKAGPPTDDELSTITVIHAVVLRAASIDEVVGTEIATNIRLAVDHALNADDFIARALAVPHGSARVVVERLAGFGVDGKLADGTELDATFVAAAFSLASPGSLSAIVATRFGWHVIRLLSRLIPTNDGIGQRRTEQLQRVINLRARVLVEAIIQAHKGKEHPQLSIAAESLMGGARAPF